MRFATYQRDGRESFGLVLRHPRDAADWVFDPAAVEASARGLPAMKGAGYTWWRPRFGMDGAWPRALAPFLALGSGGMDAARRMQDFLLSYLERGDPQTFAPAGSPLAEVSLQAPIPEPRLLLGVVGNNAGFLRMDTVRGRNLEQPKCHQRTQTSVVGQGQPIVLPAGCDRSAGTTELGVIIGRGGRDIPREEARDHIAGYTVVNDCLGSLFARRWAELDKASGQGGTHFHSANTASWLDKKADTMLAMGPLLVTPEEVGDPYDLLCHYREGGVTRNRAYSGALCCGVEGLIHWLSQFLTLEPGMVLHLGSMGQDGLISGPEEHFGPEHFVECEIERVGALRNPLVRLGNNDWRAKEDPSRSIHPSPVVRKILASGRGRLARSSDWNLGQTRHFWTILANYPDAGTVEGIAPRTYPLAYNAPAASLARSGATVILPTAARTLTGSCELGFVIKSVTQPVSPAEAPDHILGYVVLAVLRDSSFRDALLHPHVLHAGIPDIYSRWPEGFNIIGELPAPLDDFRRRRMRFAINGVGEIESWTDVYLLDAAKILSELSRGVTLLPGDVVTLGFAGRGLVVPDTLRLPKGTGLTAGIDGLIEVTATIVDQRELDPAGGGEGSPAQPAP